MIDLNDKKFLKKLSKDLNNGKFHLDEKSSIEIYKPSGNKIYIVVNNKSNLTLFRNTDLSLVVKEFNKNIQEYNKQNNINLKK